MDNLWKLNNNIVIQEPREYLGLSMVGHSCKRYLQYYHYWTFRISYSTRIQRLFNTGHLAEEVMINDLASIGIEVADQQKRITGIGGHWKGHIDGLIENGTKLIEFKTHKDSSFKKIKKSGVKTSAPTHFYQMQAYMSGLDLSSALYMAINKDTSEYYFEDVSIDFEAVSRNNDIQNEVLISTDMIDKIGTGTKTWFECRFCDARDVCHEERAPIVTCRSCAHVDVCDDGIWTCSITDITLTKEDQKKACCKYELSDMLK